MGYQDYAATQIDYKKQNLSYLEKTHRTAQINDRFSYREAIARANAPLPPTNCCLIFLAGNLCWFAKSNREKDSTQSQSRYQNINSCFHRENPTQIMVYLKVPREKGSELIQPPIPSIKLLYLVRVEGSPNFWNNPHSTCSSRSASTPANTSR